MATKNIYHHRMATKFWLSQDWQPKNFNHCRVGDWNLFLVAHHSKRNPSVKIFFLVLILMDMTKALRRTPTWCVTQNGCVTFVLTTLIVNILENEFSIKDLVDMQVTKKDGNLYRPRRYVSFVCFVFHVVFFFQNLF
jgi:hypothetical protein